MHLLQRLGVESLGDALHIGGRSRAAGAFGDGVRHRLDVGIGGVVQNENFGTHQRKVTG